MSTLIVYASSKGYTRECALHLQQQISGDVDVADLKKVKHPDLSGYDRVIIGASIHASNLQGSVKRFAQSHEEELLKKQLLAIYICALDDQKWEEYLNQLPAPITARAQLKEWFGGRIIFSEHFFLLRKFLKKVTGSVEDLHKEQPERVERFIEAYHQLLEDPA